MKNIVVCCDGTGAEYGRDSENTNVVRLFELLIPDGDDQISYYDPGVGTYSPLGNPFRSWLEKQVMMASGRGITLSVQKAYKYLMDYFEPEDRVFLFGFSRGAHTVRELASLIQRCGLLTKGSENLIPYAIRIWQSGDGNRMSGFRMTFSRQNCKPHLIGVWDAVAAVGWLAWRRYYKHRQPSPEISFSYHAAAIDENRWYFQISDWDENQATEGQIIEQVWFPGSHGDVGGPGQDRRVSNIPLAWMLGKAESHGMLLAEGWRDRLPQDATGGIRQPRRSVWRLAPPKKRAIPKGAKIHRSAVRREEILGDAYRPTNLPEPEHRVEVE